jgi:DNA-binding winged helix-turn-helix (wHTH) protein/Flp pilus assembly protein TadD
MEHRPYRFGAFTLDASRCMLYRGDAAVALGPKPIALLAILVERAGSLAGKDELMNALWPGGFVEEGNLTQYVYLLRGALRDGGLPHAIETVPRRGYRFVAPVDVIERPASRAPADSAPRRHGRLRIIAFAACAALMMVPSVPAAPAFARLSAESQRMYALGRFHWNMRGDGLAQSLNESVRDFQAVVAADPRNPLGYAGLADAYLSIYDYPCDERGCTHIAARALQHARRAVELGPDSAEAHTSLAMTVHALAGDDLQADREFRRAIELDPRYATARAWYGTMLTLHGRYDEARVQLTAAVALDPVSPASYAWLARNEYYAHRYSAAIVYAREALALEPRRFETHVVLGLSVAASGDARSAIRAFEELGRIGGDPIQVRSLIATAYAEGGDVRHARALVATLPATTPQGADFATDIAMARLAAGDVNGALSFLRAAPPLDAMHHRLFANDPRLDRVRDDWSFRRWTVASAT